MSTAQESLKYVAQVLEDHMPLIALDDFSPLESKEHRDDIRVLVDRRISLLLDQVLKLKRYRNTIATISILPDVILGQIFFEYVLLSDPWEGKWTKILFVCRRWADLCMNNPKLWSFIHTHLSSSSLTRALRWVKRSAEHPVSCKMELFKDNPLNGQILLRCLHRIHRLHVSGQAAEIEALFSTPGVEKGLPILEELTVRCSNQAWTLPSFLLQDVAFRYRSLILSNAQFPSIDNFNLLENLTKLVLECYGTVIGAMPTMKDLANALEKSPRIQKLKLVKYIRRSEDPLENCFSSVALPELAALCLNLDQGMAAQIFENLTIPASTRLQLTLRPIDFSAIFLLLLRHFRLPGAPTLRSSAFTDHGGRSFTFNADTETICPSPVFYRDDAVFSLTVYRLTKKELHRLARSLLRTLPFDPSGLSIDATAIMNFSQVTEYTWRTIFEELSIPMEVQIGCNEGLIPLLRGLLLALKAWRYLRSSRYRKLHPSPPTLHNLRIAASVDPAQFSEKTRSVADDLQLHRYSRLVKYLTRYRDMNVIGKPRGQKFQKVTVERVEEHTKVYDAAPNIFEVCDILTIDEIVWDPFEIAKEERKWARWERRWERERKIEAGEPVSEGEIEEEEEEEPVIDTVLETPAPDVFSRFPVEFDHLHSDDFAIVFV
ncbi:hypothetical protein C8J56DRAFT_1162538 [Mycena floridula]|nr:hypothetical protein C8J56DRAFT_1162538 [Mycena floridula]